MSSIFIWFAREPWFGLVLRVPTEVESPKTDRDVDRANYAGRSARSLASWLPIPLVQIHSLTGATELGLNRDSDRLLRGAVSDLL